MSTFAELLAELPSVDHLAAIELQPEAGGAVVRIENKPGQAGSLRLYHALFQRFGEIDHQAAEEGLRLYAEHTADGPPRQAPQHRSPVCCRQWRHPLSRDTHHPLASPGEEVP